jgi:hypothetical protein
MKRYELKIIVGGGKLENFIEECDDLLVDEDKYRFINYNVPEGIGRGAYTAIAIYPIEHTIISKIRNLD